MGRAKRLTGRMRQADSPEWTPLLDLIGDENVVGDFMWMFEVELTDGLLLQAYKHIDTRRYIHLNAAREAFVFEPPDRYRRGSAVDALTEVFRPLPELAGVMDSQVEAAWRVVEKLNGGSES